MDLAGYMSMVLMLVLSTDATVTLFHNESSNTFVCGRVVQLTCVVSPKVMIMSWSKDGAPLTDCFDDSNDNCLLTSKDNYKFTSDVSNDEYFLVIDTVRLTDRSSFQCSAGAENDEKQITVNSVAENSTSRITESLVSGTVTISALTGCISSSAVKMEWYYYQGTENPIKISDSNVTRSQDNSSCVSGVCTSGDGIAAVTDTAVFTVEKGNIDVFIRVVFIYAETGETLFYKDTSEKYKIIKGGTEPCLCLWWCILLIVIGCLYFCGIMIGICMYCCKDEPDIKRCVGDKIPCWVRILICILMIIIIVGLGILTVYGICKCFDCFGCCGGCCGGYCDDCCGSSNAKNESEPDPMQEKMKMAEDLASNDQDKNAL